MVANFEIIGKKNFRLSPEQKSKITVFVRVRKISYVKIRNHRPKITLVTSFQNKVKNSGFLNHCDFVKKKVVDLNFSYLLNNFY